MAKQTHDRRKFLGGSDVAALQGFSIWATPLDVYYRKVGIPKEIPLPGPDPQRERMLRRGKLMEPVVVDMLKAEYPITITKRSTPRKPNRYADCDHPFLAAEIDFEWRVTPAMQALLPALAGLEVGSIQNGEVKTVHPFAANVYGDAGTDEIPVQYAYQAMHGMGVTGRQACLVPVLVGSDNLILYLVLRDEAIVTEMRARSVKFWFDHVLKGVPPDPIRIEDTHKLLRIRKDINIQADAEMVALVQELKNWSSMKSSAEAGQKEIQFKIISKMIGAEAAESQTMEGRHRVMVGGDAILTVALQSREFVQQSELKKDHPAIYAQYVKPSTFFVCSPSRKKT